MSRHAQLLAEVPLYAEPQHIGVATASADIVHAADRAAWLEEQPTAPYTAREPAGLREELAIGLREFRAELQGMDNNTRSLITPYVQSLLPRHATYEYADSEGRPTLKTLQRMSEADTVAFLRRHVPAVAQNEADVQPFINGKKQEFLDGIERGIDQQWISPAAVALEEQVLSGAVRIVDWWEKGMYGIDGRYIRATNDIWAVHGLGATCEARRADFETRQELTLPHEWWHGFDISSYGRDSWLAEAAAEHLSVAAKHGEPHTLRPEDRTHDTGVYTEFRNLSAEMMDGLHSYLFTRAVSSGSMDSAEWQQLDAALQEKYGVAGMPAHISNRYYRYREHYSRTTNLSVHAQEAKAAQEVEKELHNKQWVITGLRPRARDMGRFVTGQLTRGQLS